MDSIPYPLVNGNRFSWSSVVLKLAGATIVGIKSINYSQELKPGAVFGTHPQKIGRTRGEGLNPDCSVEMYKEEFAIFLKALDPAGLGGIYETEFEVVASYEDTQGIVTDKIHNCRLTKADDSHSQSGDALTVKCDLDVMWIEYDGHKPLRNMLTGIN